MACGVGIAAVGLLIALASSVVFHAKTYAGIMAVTEKEAIADDLPSAETTSSIALMDTDSAAKLGRPENRIPGGSGQPVRCQRRLQPDRLPG